MSDASKINDGGAAFPHMAPTGFYTTREINGGSYAAEPQLAPVPGLTKRDYFAAAALPALISTLSETLLGGGLTAEQIEELIAGQAFGVADAMIAASKTGGPEHG